MTPVIAPCDAARCARPWTLGVRLEHDGPIGHYCTDHGGLVVEVRRTVELLPVAVASVPQ